MSTIREQILTAIATALVGTAGVGTRIYRSRPEAVSRAESPALLIEPVQNQSQQFVIGYLQHTLTVNITVISRGAIPDQLADSTINSLHGKLMADLTLGGLCQDVQPGATRFSIEDGDQPAAAIACEYNIIYRTTLTNLSASV